MSKANEVSEMIEGEFKRFAKKMVDELEKKNGKEYTDDERKELEAKFLNKMNKKKEK